MSDPSRVRVSGPLLEYVSGFGEELVRQGYGPDSATGQLHLMANLSCWLGSWGLGAGDLTPARVDDFVVWRRSQGYTQRRSAHALEPLLGYLRALGVAPVSTGVVGSTSEELLERYSRYLVGTRGLAPKTVQRYVTWAAAGLLAGLADPGGGLDLERLTGRFVIEFVAVASRRLCPGSAKDLVVCLRSFLRFLYGAGLVRSDLSGVLPSVAVWGGGSLPKALAPEQVTALLDSCDGDSAIGLRDFAVMTLLARLGLRSGEVAALEVGDFDWRAGEVTVRGKGGRVEQMPLPVDVGEAVTGYLVGGRPRARCRSVFLRVCAPIVGIGPVGVSSIVRRACERAGLAPCGAHRLRHSAATAMLRSGGSLGEIGQVLRHRSGPATTGIYAKVDHTALRTVAQPWPGGAA